MLGELVKKAIKQSGKQIGDIAVSLDISREHFSRMLKEDVPDFYVQRIKKLGVDFDNVILIDKSVPYYDVDATAGNFTIFTDSPTELIKQYINIPAFSDCDMFINVSGDSMYPKYCTGELIALKKINDREVISYGEAHVIVTKEQILLKRLHKSTNENMFFLRNENKAHDDFEIKKEKILFLYLVKGKITKNVI